VRYNHSFMRVRLAAALLIWGVASTTLGFASHPQAQRGIPQYLNTQPGVKYVGSEVCARCHPNIYHEYFRTAMGRSMSLPDNPSLPSPRAPVRVYSYRLDRDFAIFRRASGLYQTELKPAPNGADVFHDTQRIAYAIGAGRDGISYLVRQGNYLVEAPLSYYTQTHTWQLSPGYEAADVGFDRVVTEACLTCHSGLPQPVQSRPGLYKNPPIKHLAIGCESCYGPAQLHVEERMNGEPVNGPGDRSIVTPANLSHRRGIDQGVRSRPLWTVADPFGADGTGGHRFEARYRLAPVFAEAIQDAGFRLYQTAGVPRCTGHHEARA
jgi:hypothetical protein